jgi:poly(hydroxyalkanoate) depolymerase family esterase
MRLALLALATLAACGAPSEDATDVSNADLATSGLREVTGFGSNPGALRMFEHVPKNVQENAPVVVVLHGCMTNAGNIADTGWNDLADARGFVVVYPQQSYWNNGTLCFNWADPMGFGHDDAERGGGESESIRQMTKYALARHHGDASRGYAAGFSAGAAMAVNLAAV